MQPPFGDDPLRLGVFVVSCVLWFGLEFAVDLTHHMRRRAGIQRRDKGSYLVIALLIRLGAAVCVLLAFTVPATAMITARVFLFWLGILLMYSGLVLRLYAIHLLGDSFTTTVTVTPEQPVIEAGPYRFIRHPAYSGFLMTLLGFGLCFANWLGLLILVACAVPGFGYRIHIEERALQEQLGQPYQDYMRRTKRLIPFVF